MLVDCTGYNTCLLGFPKSGFNQIYKSRSLDTRQRPSTRSYIARNASENVSDLALDHI